MLRSGLALWAYTAPSGAYPLLVGEYGEQVEALEFSTVAPGRRAASAIWRAS